jgi:hypothetical protein
MGVPPTQSSEQLPRDGLHSKMHFESALQVREQLPKPSHFTSHSLPAEHVDWQSLPSHS